ncbi:MAG TPA: polysaccharide deacetylase family protein [Amycolatopsis sp.]|nr:polysaccharide deacetylase family protein [Amycolatopsis sp.]
MNAPGDARRLEPVPILLYHSVAPVGLLSGDDHWQVGVSDFRKDMESVVETGRTPMTAEAYADWLRSGDPCLRPVLVTFDDGFADFADVALPVLQELGMCATIFVTSGWVGRKGMLSAAAVRELAEDGTEIGGHAVTHPHLDTISTGGARGEILGCRHALEDMTGRWVTSFAYPHGSFHHRTRRLVIDSGYRTAHAVKNALSHGADDPFAVGRFTVTATTSREQVQAVLDGRGAPLAWRRERLRTRGYRVVRRARAAGLPV